MEKSHGRKYNECLYYRERCGHLEVEGFFFIQAACFCLSKYLNGKPFRKNPYKVRRKMCVSESREKHFCEKCSRGHMWSNKS